MTDVIVIGGGLSGLLVAALLAKLDHTVTLVESEKQPGGRLHIVSSQDFALGSGYLFNGAEQGVVSRVLQNCGIYSKSDFIGSEAKTNFMLSGDKISPQPLTPLLTWKNPYLSFRERWAFYNLVSSANRSNPARVRQANMTLSDWVKRHAPEEVSRELWLKLATLLTYDPNPPDLSAADFLETLQSGGRNRYSGLYFRGGLANLIQKLVNVITTASTSNQILLGSKVQTVATDGTRLKSVQLETGKILEANCFINTVPTPYNFITNSETLAEEFEQVRPLQGNGMLRFEIGLASKVRLDAPTLYDLENRILFTDLTYYDPSLAPSNTQLLQFQAFLNHSDNLDTDGVATARPKQQILSMAEKYLKNWQQDKIVDRWTFVPKAVSVRHTIAQLNHLLPVKSRACPNLFYAGDNVLNKRQLSDLIFNSAEAAVIAVDQFLDSR